MFYKLNSLMFLVYSSYKDSLYLEKETKFSNSAPQSKNAVCALQNYCKLLPFPWRNSAEMSRRLILFHD